jgi:hypothetical protein
MSKRSAETAGIVYGIIKRRLEKDQPPAVIALSPFPVLRYKQQFAHRESARFQ